VLLAVPVAASIQVVVVEVWNATEQDGTGRVDGEQKSGAALPETGSP